MRKSRKVRRDEIVGCDDAGGDRGTIEVYLGALTWDMIRDVVASTWDMIMGISVLCYVSIYCI
jgi:hypothetical protein